MVTRRAVTKVVADVIWAAVKPMLTKSPDTHPLGCHRRCICDRLCLRGIVIWLVTGWSRQIVERTNS